MKPTWKSLFLAARNIIGILGWWALGIITLVVIVNGYTVPWTGFGDYTTATGDIVRGKTLWDWMQLLIIPLFLWAGATTVNRNEKEIERHRLEERTKLEHEIATDRQQEAALQAYLDRMTELLLEKKLATTEDEEVRNVARIRTLTVLRGLDARRKGFVIQFLSEAELIENLKTIISLKDADLRGADLFHENLADTNLKGAILNNANFGYAILERVHLIGAILSNANLLGAYLADALLSGAIVDKADNVFNIQLSDAKSLKGTIMPDGTIHE